MLKSIKNFFLGGGSSGKDDRSHYFYVRVYRMPHRPTENDEIVRIRVDMLNELSADEEGTYFVRKGVVGSRTFAKGELIAYFDKNRRLANTEIENGELVTEDEYKAYEAQRDEV